MSEDYMGPADKSDFAIRPGDGPKRYFKDESGNLQVQAVRRPVDGIETLLQGFSAADLQGRSSGMARFVKEKGGWSKGAAAGAGDREDPYPVRSGEYPNSGSDRGQTEDFEPDYDANIDILLQDEGEVPKEEGDLLDYDERRARPAVQDIVDMEEFINMDIFDQFDKDSHEGDTYEDFPRATTRQGPSPGDFHPPRTQPRTYKKTSALDELESLFGDD